MVGYSGWANWCLGSFNTTIFSRGENSSFSNEDPCTMYLNKHVYSYFHLFCQVCGYKENAPRSEQRGGGEMGKTPRGCCDGNPTLASVNSSQLQPQLAMSKPWRQPAGHTKKKTQTHAKATTQTLSYAQTRTTLIAQHAYTTPDV